MSTRRGAAALLVAAALASGCAVSVTGIPSAASPTATVPTSAPPTSRPVPTPSAPPTRPELDGPRTLVFLATSPCRALDDDQVLTLGYTPPGTELFDESTGDYGCEWSGVDRSILFGAGYGQDRVTPLLRQTEIPVRPIQLGPFSGVEVLLPGLCGVVVLLPDGSTTVVAGGDGGVRMISSTPSGEVHCDAARRVTEAILENAG